MAASVFLNYRRDDTAGYARSLYERLGSRFPGRVFMDTGEIQPGVDFTQALEEAILRSSVVLVLIGPRWMTERLRDSSDYVRLEISTALRRGIR